MASGARGSAVVAALFINIKMKNCGRKNAIYFGAKRKKKQTNELKKNTVRVKTSTVETRRGEGVVGSSKAVFFYKRLNRVEVIITFRVLTSHERGGQKYNNNGKGKKRK